VQNWFLFTTERPKYINLKKWHFLFWRAFLFLLFKVFRHISPFFFFNPKLSELSFALNKPDSLSWVSPCLQLDAGGLWKAERKRETMKASVRVKLWLISTIKIKPHLRLQVGLIFSILNVLRLGTCLVLHREPGVISSYLSVSVSDVCLDENSRHRLVGTPLILFEPKNLFCSYKPRDLMLSQMIQTPKHTVGFVSSTSERWQLNYRGRVCPWSVCAASASIAQYFGSIEVLQQQRLPSSTFPATNELPSQKPLRLTWLDSLTSLPLCQVEETGVGPRD